MSSRVEDLTPWTEGVFAFAFSLLDSWTPLMNPFKLKTKGYFTPLWKGLYIQKPLESDFELCFSLIYSSYCELDFRFEVSEVENLSWQSFKSSTELELDFQDLRFLSLRNASLSSWVEELKLETSNLRDQWLRLWVWELELEFWKFEFKKVGFEIAVLQFEDWVNWLWVLGFWVPGFQYLTFILLV